MFLFPSVYTESESRPEQALKGPSAGNQSMENDFEIWQPTATSTECEPPSYFLLLWLFSVDWGVALMIILVFSCFVSSLTDYRWIIFKHQKPQKGKSGLWSTMAFEKKNKALVSRWGNGEMPAISSDCEVLCNTVCDCHVSSESYNMSRDKKKITYREWWSC